MDFIGRILGKIVYIFGIMVSSFFSQVEGKAVQKPYIKYTQEIYNSFIKEMQKYGFRCVLDSSGMPFDVRELGLGFVVYQKGTIEEGREKIVFLTEKFLEAINSHEAIRPYLREYPFPESRVSVSLAFKQQGGLYYKDGSITNIYHARSKLIYCTEDPVNEQCIDVFEENYINGLAKVNKTQIVSNKAEHATQENNIVPTKQRLGTLNTSLGGFTPERVLESVGIKNIEGRKEFADELGELIGGICDEYFGEEFLERVAQTVNKNRTGEYVEYWDNGQMKTRIPYKNGYAEGHIHGWYPNGEGAFKGFYKEGKRVGIQLARYPIRALDPIGRLLEYDMEGKLHGRQMTSDVNDRLLANIYYNHGILHGNISFYDSKRAGVCYGEWEYKNGKVKKVNIPPSTTGIKRKLS